MDNRYPRKPPTNTLELQCQMTWAGTSMHRRSKPGLPGLLELYVELLESVIKKWKTLHTSSLLDLSWSMPRVHGVLTYKKMLTSLRAFNVRLPDLSFMTTGENPVWPLCFHPLAGTPCRTDASLVSVRCSTKSIICMSTLPCLQSSALVQECLDVNARNIPDIISNVISLFAEWTVTCTACSQDPYASGILSQTMLWH